MLAEWALFGFAILAGQAIDLPDATLPWIIGGLAVTIAVSVWWASTDAGRRRRERRRTIMRSVPAWQSAAVTTLAGIAAAPIYAIGRDVSIWLPLGIAPVLSLAALLGRELEIRRGGGTAKRSQERRRRADEALLRRSESDDEWRQSTGR